MELLPNDEPTKALFTDVNDLAAHGVLWWLNRVAFHPRGLALAISENGSFELWADDEPWAFNEEIDRTKSLEFEQLVRWVHGIEAAPAESRAEPCAANPKDPWQCAYAGQDGKEACKEECLVAKGRRQAK